MSTVASEFAAKYPTANDLMTALDAAGIPSEQDWENESTTWSFEDGSKIRVSGSDIAVEQDRAS